MEEKSKDTRHEESSSSDDEYAPPLPPGYKRPEVKPKIVGPTLPAGMQLPEKSPEAATEKSPSPEINQSESSDDDDSFVIGPLPPGETQSSKSYAKKLLEERSKRMKDKLTAKPDTSAKREEWMLELPPEKSKLLGLGPRTFSTKPSSSTGGDRSGWTEIKGQEKKVTEKMPTERDWQDYSSTVRDEKIEKELKKIGKGKEKESLLESHKKKRKKNEEEAGPAVRKPFDREADLQISRNDPKMTDSVIKKAKLLDTRFSSGQTKYL